MLFMTLLSAVIFLIMGTLNARLPKLQVFRWESALTAFILISVHVLQFLSVRGLISSPLFYMGELLQIITLYLLIISAYPLTSLIPHYIQLRQAGDTPEPVTLKALGALTTLCLVALFLVYVLFTGWI